MRRLQFGIGHDFRNMDPSRSTFAEVYARSIDRVVQAEALGYDYVFIGEHHLTPDGHAPSLFPLFAAIASRTERIRMNTYVFLLPLHHPLNVAEDVTAVDLLSDGRMELGVGLGYRSEEFTAFGVDRSQRGRIMDESCEILLKAWTETGWSYHGKHFQLDNIDVVPKPVQSPHPKLWVSARNERAARRAARLKAPLMIAPSPYTEDAAVVYGAYADALREAGEDPAGYDVMGSYTVQVLDPGERAIDPKGADSRLQQYIDWYAQDGDLPDDAGRIANPSERLRRQIGVTGEAAACIEGIEELLEQVPFTLLMVGGISTKQMTRFMEQVAPRFPGDHDRAAMGMGDGDVSDDNQVLLAGGFGFLEAPRWHDGRLWVSDMARHAVFTVDASGGADVVCELDDSPSGLGWLPDGRLLVVSMHARKVLRREHDGELVVHADLGPLVEADLNDMVVDASGRAYVTNFGYDAATSEPKTTGIVLVHPDGSAEPPVGELFRPNGIGIVQDGSTLVVAETRVHRLTAFGLDPDGSLHDQRTIGVLPSGSWADGLCLDAEDAVWVADPKGRRCFRLTAAGETTDVIETAPMPTVSCALGGEDRRTLFLTLAPIRPFDQAADGGEAEIRTVRVDVPGAGWP